LPVLFVKFHEATFSLAIGSMNTSIMGLVVNVVAQSSQFVIELPGLLPGQIASIGLDLGTLLAPEVPCLGFELPCLLGTNASAAAAAA
jgi:hypothetical protein